MDQTVLAGKHFHEGPKGHRICNLASVDRSDLYLGKHVLDHLLGALQRLCLGGVNMHRPVILDIDLGSRLGLDALDVLSTRTDQFPDPIGINFHGLDPRSVLAELADLGNCLGHGFLHLGAAFLGHMHRGLEDIHRDSPQLQVELEPSDSFTGSTEFPVHVAVEVFATDDIHEQFVLLQIPIIVEVRHETDRDPTYGTLQRHPGLQEGHRPGTHGGHRGRAIRFEHFRCNTDRIGKLFHVGNDRRKGTLAKSPVSDLTPVQTTKTTRLTHREWWEGVV